MPLTIEREKIRKEELDYPNYAVPSLWWSSGISGISRAIKQPCFSSSVFIDEFITSVKDTNVTIKVQDFKILIPNSLRTLANEIEKSKYLLDLKEDWDDEGGLPIEFVTWKRAISFLVDYALWLYNDQQYFVIEPPQINSGPGSSIDLLWRNDKYRLLVNISEDSEKPIEYYGDNNLGENSIKGKLKPGFVQEFFALWVKNLKK